MCNGKFKERSKGRRGCYEHLAVRSDDNMYEYSNYYAQETQKEKETVKKKNEIRETLVSCSWRHFERTRRVVLICF